MPLICIVWQYLSFDRNPKLQVPPQAGVVSLGEFCMDLLLQENLQTDQLTGPAGCHSQGPARCEDPFLDCKRNLDRLYRASDRRDPRTLRPCRTCAYRWRPWGCSTSSRCAASSSSWDLSEVGLSASALSASVLSPWRVELAASSALPLAEWSFALGSASARSPESLSDLCVQLRP